MSAVFTPTGALRARYAILMVLVAAVLVSAGGWGYTNHVQRQADARYMRQSAIADARWCALFALLDPQGAPPTTERGRLVAGQIRRLSAEFHCKGQP